eukprot:4387898-Karenia_brevis.AAC.1
MAMMRMNGDDDDDDDDDDGVGECASRPRRRPSRCGNAIHHSPLGSTVGITASAVTRNVRD